MSSAWERLQAEKDAEVAELSASELAEEISDTCFWIEEEYGDKGARIGATGRRIKIIIEQLEHDLAAEVARGNRLEAECEDMALRLNVMREDE